MKYRIVTPHAPEPGKVLAAIAGERLRWERRATQWDGWLFCTTADGVSGWVPEAWLELDGAQAAIRRDYDAAELTVVVGNVVEGDVIESEWLLARDEAGRCGWVPLACVEALAMQRIGVFCGSSAGARPEYARAAVALADVLVARGLGLAYGGGRVGLMGRIAEAVAAAGGEVIGVIPEFLVAQELAYGGATELRRVQSMSERKAVMAELSDAFIALPGGYGTLDELIEMLTWTQLGIHQKPCGLLNTCGYYDDLIAFVDKSVTESFVRDEHRSMLIVDEDPAALVERLQNYRHPVVDKTRWIIDLEDGGSAAS